MGFVIEYMPVGQGSFSSIKIPFGSNGVVFLDERTSQTEIDHGNCDAYYYDHTKKGMVLLEEQRFRRGVPVGSEKSFLIHRRTYTEVYEKGIEGRWVTPLVRRSRYGVVIAGFVSKPDDIHNFRLIKLIARRGKI